MDSQNHFRIANNFHEQVALCFAMRIEANSLI